MKLSPFILTALLTADLVKAEPPAISHQVQEDEKGIILPLEDWKDTFFSEENEEEELGATERLSDDQQDQVRALIIGYLERMSLPQGGLTYRIGGDRQEHQPDREFRGLGVDGVSGEPLNEEERNEGMTRRIVSSMTATEMRERTPAEGGTWSEWKPAESKTEKPILRIFLTQGPRGISLCHDDDGEFVPSLLEEAALNRKSIDDSSVPLDHPVISEESTEEKPDLTASDETNDEEPVLNVSIAEEGSPAPTTPALPTQEPIRKAALSLPPGMTRRK